MKRRAGAQDTLDFYYLGMKTAHYYLDMTTVHYFF